MAKEVTMSASAEVRATKHSHPAPRGAELPTCPVCADSMIAAESSAFLADNVVSYLWTCDTCGYGFVTNHAMKKIVCG
jgi:C4-type Zn-finger protein